MWATWTWTEFSSIKLLICYQGKIIICSVNLEKVLCNMKIIAGCKFQGCYIVRWETNDKNWLHAWLWDFYSTVSGVAHFFFSIIATNVTIMIISDRLRSRHLCCPSYTIGSIHLGTRMTRNQSFAFFPNFFCLWKALILRDNAQGFSKTGDCSQGGRYWPSNPRG